MKKIYTMVAAALAVGISANALGLTPTEVEIANPSFEEGAWVPDNANHNVLPEELAATGWQVVGGAGVNENTTASGFYANQQRPKSWTDGAQGFRSATEPTAEGGNYLMQEILGQTPGTYVLQFDGMISRNTWQNPLSESLNEETGLPDAFGFAFVCDDMGDPDNEESNPNNPETEGMSCVYTWSQNSGTGNRYATLSRFYVVHTTHADLEDETGIKFGFGLPVNSAAVTKARIAFDNFHLYYFDTKDTEAVKAYVNDNLIAAVEAGEFEENGVKVPMTVVNPKASTNKFILGGIITNTRESQGITDVTVAPVVEGNNKYYNLQGIEVADPTQPGLYIHNGKKILVK